MKRLLAQVLLFALVGILVAQAQTAAPAPKKRKPAPKASAPSVATQLKTMSEALEAQQKQIQELRQEIQTRDQAVQQLQQRLDQSQTAATQAAAKADSASAEASKQGQSVTALRSDVDDLKQRVIRSLDRSGRRRWFGINDRVARIALSEVADVASPKILELGSGLGGLSGKLLEKHPTAQVTVTDIDPTLVAAVAAGDLGSHPRATVREMDATAIDAPEWYYDLAVFVLSLHHLPPELAARVFAEGTRAANKLLIIDLRRRRPPVQLVMLALILPITGLIPLLHDGVISSLRAYSPSALRALAQYADPAITVEFRARPWGATAMVASRARQAGNPQ